jgi:hypothetical protein
MTFPPRKIGSEMDKDIFAYPYFLKWSGQRPFQREEFLRLRHNLQAAVFCHADDNYGWTIFRREIKRVFPDNECRVAVQYPTTEFLQFSYACQKNSRA